MGALAIPKVPVEQYLALDREAEFKSEYHDGVLFPICAVSLEHGRLGAKLAHCLVERLEGGSCIVVVSPVRVRVSPAKFVYPDILVICGEPNFTDEQVDTVTNPKVIIEILSPSTMDYDYGTKSLLYRELPSLEEYVLVSQETHRIEVLRRTTGRQWLITPYLGLDAVLALESLNISIPLVEIYSAIID